ncbi:hypothetical protein, partial [Maricaulis sp.]|uniref:hypothetical protein n=1 Tax=Maricaulis sp. TaxID=1486257 RepID=UPI0025C55832
GLTHRRAPPPAFLFPINNVKEPDHKNQGLPGPHHLGFLRKSSVTGARCLGRAVFEVNRLFQPSQQQVQSGGFSCENQPAMNSQSPMISWKYECLPSAGQIRLSTNPPGEERGV